jgi:hypothetical protein
MQAPSLNGWQKFLSQLTSRFSSQARPRRRSPVCSHVLADLELLEPRALLSVTVVSNYAGLNYNQTLGYVPPDSCGAAGPTSYVQTVNQDAEIFRNKATGSPRIIADLGTFFFTTGGLPHASPGSGLSDPIVVYDEKIQRFIIGDQDVDFNSHVSNFDVAVSTTNNPANFSAASWKFYRISTTEAGHDADYPGNFGYNNDAFVFTLNMFGVSGDVHVQINSVSAADLMNGVSNANLHAFRNDQPGISWRPTTMHDSVAGDPMWFVTETGNNTQISVIKMTNVLSKTASFTTTKMSVTPYQQTVAPLNPDGSPITFNIDSRILKSAEANNTIVATHIVATASGIEDDAQWYAIRVNGGMPVLAQQGRISSGANTYITYPGIDINPSGQIGMTYMQSGNDTASDFMSMFVTLRAPTDPVGTMETAMPVPAGVGAGINFDGRSGDLSGINIDPVDGTFWATNEYTDVFNNWGLAVANFTLNTNLTAPQNVQAVVQNSTSALVSWNTVVGADLGYQVYLKNGPSNILLGSAPSTATSLLVSGLTPGALNTLFVRALSSTLPPFFADSNTVTVLTPAAVPAPVVDTPIILSDSSAQLNWGAVAGITGFRVFERINGQVYLIGILPPSATSLYVGGLTHGQIVQFLIESFNGNSTGDSPWFDVTT